MRLVRGILASSVCFGLALAATSAFAGVSSDRIDDAVFVTDSDTGDEAVVVIASTTFFVSGEVTGIGTDGDAVSIGLFTPFPNKANANSKKGSVSQNGFSELTFVIESDDPTRDLDTTLTIEKCNINSSVNVDSEKGKVTAKCKGDNVLAVFTADQLASMLAAFNDNKRVKIKANSNNLKGSISITFKGTAIED